MKFAHFSIKRANKNHAMIQVTVTTSFAILIEHASNLTLDPATWY